MIAFELVICRNGKRAVGAAKFTQREKAERYLAQYIGCCLQNDMAAHVKRHGHHRFVVSYKQGGARYVFLKRFAV